MNFHGVPELGMAVAHEGGVRLVAGVVDEHLPHTPNALGGDVKQLEVAQQVVHGRCARSRAAVDCPSDADHRAGHVPTGQQFAFRFQFQSLAGVRRHAASDNEPGETSVR
jgi:hypothetical protein